MLDVHILVMGYTPDAVVARCRESVRAAAAAAGFPVAVHVLPGIVGHLGAARKAGYARGSYPYVTHVDDDDWVEDNAFAVLTDQLHAGRAAITTGENIVTDGASRAAPRSRHHLAVFRRDVLADIDYQVFRFYPDQFALSMVDAQHIPVCVYNHVIRVDSGSRVQRRDNAAEAQREMDAIRRPDLVVFENSSLAELAAATALEMARV